MHLKIPFYRGKVNSFTASFCFVDCYNFNNGINRVSAANVTNLPLQSALGTITRNRKHCPKQIATLSSACIVLASRWCGSVDVSGIVKLPLLELSFRFCWQIVDVNSEVADILQRVRTLMRKVFVNLRDANMPDTRRSEFLKSC